MSPFLQCITVLLLTTVTRSAVANCQNHETLRDPWRNIGFMSPGEPWSGADLKEGWYKLDGIAGNQVVQYCSSPSNLTYILNNKNTTKLNLYTCDAHHSTTGIMCAQQNISIQDCGGGLILHYLVPNSGFYAMRHSSCKSTSCGANAQCGFVYGSCECNPGLYIPHGLMPTGDSYGCTDFIMPQSEKCQADFTLECVEILLNQIQNNTATVIPTVVIVHTLEQLMNSTKILEDATSDQSKLVEYGNALLNATETLVSTLVTKTNTSYYRNITLPSVQAAVYVFGPNASLKELPQLNTTNAYLDINFSGENKGIDAVLFLSYTNMSSFLKPDLFKPSSNTKATMLSTVVTVKLLGTSNQATPIQQFKRAADLVTNVINVTLEHGPMDAQGTLYCVNWKETQWEDGNCKVFQLNSTYTKCHCAYPGTFALIMQTSGSSMTPRSLATVNKVAMAVGLFFLTLALLTFAVCQRNPKTINTALINLCISLFLAHLLFLLTQEFLIEISFNPLACRVMAGVLHFLFLSAFVWMFIEAVLLFIIVKNLTEIRARQEILSWKCLIVIGYVIPLFVVGVSVGLFPDGYGSKQCWLKSDKDFTWSFLAPVCLILGVNTLLFIAIGVRMAATLKKLNNETLEIKVTKSDKNLIKSVMLKTLLQFVVIGCPWFLGFFTQNSEVMMVLFLIFNSQQGTFIFFVHCFLNHEIRQQYKKLLYGFCSSRK